MRDKSGRFTKSPKRTLETDVADIYWMLVELQKDFKALRSEAGEHWRQVEGDIEQIQKFVGVLSRPPGLQFKGAFEQSLAERLQLVKKELSPADSLQALWKDYKAKRQAREP
jgi:hypothetical protein